jgi:hypothetical protein
LCICIKLCVQLHYARHGPLQVTRNDTQNQEITAISVVRSAQVREQRVGCFGPIYANSSARSKANSTRTWYSPGITACECPCR